MAVLERPYPRAAQNAPAPSTAARSDVIEILRRGPRRSWMVAAIVLTVVMAVLPVVQTSGMTVTGYEMQDLEQQRQDLDSRIHQRESVIAGLTALPRIEQEARRLGLEPAANVVYLNVPLPAPDRPHLPSRFAAARPEQPPPNRSVWQELLKHLPLP
jgi:hypothetical protein